MNFLKATRNYFSPRLWPRLKFDNTNPRTQNLIQEMKASHPQLTINSDQPDPKKKESSFLHFIFWCHLASLFIIIKGVMGLESVGEDPLATLSDLFVAGLNVLSFIPPMSLYKPHKSLKKNVMCEMFIITGILRNKGESIHEQLCLLMDSHKTEEILGYNVTLFPGIWEIYTPYRGPKMGRSMNTGKNPTWWANELYWSDLQKRLHHQSPPQNGVVQENWQPGACYTTCR